MQLVAAATLARAAAWRFDGDGSDDRGHSAEMSCGALAAGARLSAERAALESAYVSHQVFGAVGITLEGRIYHITRRIRQLASQPPSDASARESLLVHFQLPAPIAETGGAQ
jgi:alkylation response protein AidB-like acyl-CoA dehydrogenase